MRTIQSKITLTFILTSLSVILLLGFFLSYEIEQYFNNRLFLQLQTETSVLEGILRESAVRRESRRNVISTLEIFSRTGNLRITLIDKDGVVVYESRLADSLLPTMENHSERPEIVQARVRGTGSNSRVSTSTGEPLFYVARAADETAMQQSPFPGVRYVRVAISLTDVNKQVDEIRLNILIAGTAVLLVMILASVFISRRISHPIIEIGKIVSEIKSGNLDRKLPVRSRDEIGKLSESINEMTDKLKQDIEQLKKLERVRSEFLGNVSHELRTPIFSLKGFLETLLEGAIDDPQVNREFVKKAYHHAGRLDTLLTDLIEISRIESGEMKMSFRYFDLRSFLQQVVEDYSDDAKKKKQTISLELPQKELSAYGDKERLGQALGNIIDNAVKYSPEQSLIAIRAIERDGKVRIEIADNGPGIDQEHLPRIFERFYRVDKTRSREVGGTGLGLSIAKHIVEAHNSKIQVASEVGKGTTFFFELKQ